MDFFASQDSARKKTKLLVGYFALAVIGLILSLYLVFVSVNNWSNSNPKTKAIVRKNANGQLVPVKPGWVWWDPTIFLWSSLGTVSVILLGSGYKTMQLAAGGSVVARDLGGRLIDRNTTDTDERRLLNVVEEMSIAAGMPVPDLYLLEGEDGINAFAAGNSPGDAVIGVTRGCVRTLTRDELQGVMAHEFSHILNGDMKLNLRLIGMIHGILIIAILGRVVMRIALESRGNSRENNWRFGVIAVGGAVTALGYLGVLFGHLIKSAISRQREYLADASAVQFTRNPDGIAGALKKIGGLANKSYLQTAHAEEASHMMFGQAMKTSLFDSHPSLDDRIKRIAPHWDGEFPEVKMSAINSSLPRQDEEVNETFRMAGMAAAMGQVMAERGAAPQNAIGEMSYLDLSHAKAIQAAMPAEWRPLLTNPAGAQAMMFALILSEDAQLLEAEMATLSACIDEDTLAITLRQHRKVQDCSSSMLIAVIDLAIPALRRLSPDEYHRFTSIMHQLMASDHQIDMFEFMVQKILRRHLDVHFRQVGPSKIRYQQLQQLTNESHVILSVLARSAGGNPEQIQTSFAAAAGVIAEHGLQLPPEILDTDWEALDRALDELEHSAPLVKKQLLHACGKAVLADGSVINEEAELLRAVADTIGCPLPPFVLEAHRAAA